MRVFFTGGSPLPPHVCLPILYMRASGDKRTPERTHKIECTIARFGKEVNRMAAKFYCENCQFEVPTDADDCPYCGKHFYSVYCPRCGREGSVSEFIQGCPRCGYTKEKRASSLTKGRRRKKSGKLFAPRWMYLAAIFFLSMGILGLLVYLLFHTSLP